MVNIYFCQLFSLNPLGVHKHCALAGFWFYFLGEIPLFNLSYSRFSQPTPVLLWLQRSFFSCIYKYISIKFYLPSWFVEKRYNTWNKNSTISISPEDWRWTHEIETYFDHVCFRHVFETYFNSGKHNLKVNNNLSIYYINKQNCNDSMQEKVTK